MFLTFSRNYLAFGITPNDDGIKQFLQSMDCTWQVILERRVKGPH